jgi:hypothetical protein
MRARALILFVTACSNAALPTGWRETPLGDGARVVWDLEAEPLPEIPLPNDVATWPDPSSPTGRRVNASLVAPSGMERRLRQNFDRLDGWGTFAPISVGFSAALDTDELIDRQGRGRFRQEDFARHAIYLIDLTTGVPTPLDVNSDLFPRNDAAPNGYYTNDPRAGESNLLFETVDEDLDGDGVLDPYEDTDFDGVLDAPNTLDGRLIGTTHETVDRMLWFYERQTHTLVLRPIIPLEENREYAVVLTDRLVDASGAPVRSPFPYVHHVSQRERLASLETIFSEHPSLYGDLASRGWDGVAFAWTFTTQSISGDLVALRDGLYGRGPFAYLAEDFPARLTPVPLRGGSRTEPCEPGPRVYTVTPAELSEALDGLPVEGLGVPMEQLEAVLETLERSVSHMAFGFYESPYLLGNPDAESPDDVWDIDRLTGEARVDRDLVPFFVIVPKETEAHRQPFPVTLYAHGYGSMNLEAIAFAGLTANHGIATVSIDAQGHGIPLDASLRPLLEIVLGTNCLAPLGRALANDRARDLNGDGSLDSAGLFFSAYMFHTRDALRQSVVDLLQALRIVRSWSGHPDFPDGAPWVPGEITPRDGGQPLVFSGDVDGDGSVDLAGDFDGDGVVDVGGYDRPYFQWGSSLGAIISMLMIGVEPAITAAAPVSGGGGLFDVSLRTELSTARHPIWLRVMGPIVTGEPSSGPGPSTGCAEGSRSLRFEMPDLSERVDTEFACVSPANLDGDDVVVLTNLTNGEVRCAGVREDGRFRVAVPTSEGDGLSITIYDGGAQTIDYETCSFEGEPPPIAEVIDTWRSENGNPPAPGLCPSCAVYRRQIYEVGSRLVAPIEGLGLARQTPDLRRLAGLAQIAVDPADPINYARRVFLDPPHAEDVVDRTRSILVVNVAGDTTVPPSTGNAYARAAGIVPFLPFDAPDELADWRAPPEFSIERGYATPDDMLIELHVHEGLPWMERHPVPGGPRFLFDIDDMSEGRQYFDPMSDAQLAPEEGGLRPNRLTPPLRWGRESRTAMNEHPWHTDSGFGAFSALLNVYAIPSGQHVLLPVDPRKAFDEGEYMLNTIGWYLASGGSELPWIVLDDPFCLEQSMCFYGE